MKYQRDLVGVCASLLLVCTGIGLIGIPGVVGAEWPGWSSLMFLVAVLVLPVAWVLLRISSGTATVARWIALAAVGAVLVRLVWSAYDVGPAIVIAVLPLLAILVLAAVVLVYSWPQATSRALQDVAQRNGWRLLDPRELDLPPLPLPVGRAWSVRNVVQTPNGTAFEARWLRWHGVLCRRRRLSAFVAPRLSAALPPMEVRPGGLSRSDITLESVEFNRSFDVIGNDARYLTAVLHPRTMQALLDARPVSLALASTALVLYDDQPLTPESLTRGLANLERISIPGHVLDDWGQYAGQPSRRGLRFTDRGFDLSAGALMARLTAMTTGLLGLTLLTCLAAAATEPDFDPPRSVSTLLIAAGLLLAVAVICVLVPKRRPTLGG
ncbi:hypothetical protein ACIBL3_27140 [Kribbella sp. NPDC050124]|uniref:hypothetical protein n=1 Tax=Kribbella sp. NPDC050124 TaxID=3364114 RepID=UPI0037B24F32